MTAQVLFFNIFSEKDPHLKAVELYHARHYQKLVKKKERD